MTQSDEGARSKARGPAPDISADAKWWVLLAIGVGTFMSAMDSSIVNAVLPVIRRSFESEVGAVQWVVTTYLLVVSGLLLSFGRLGDLHGHKRVYVSGFAIFVLSSVGCSQAPAVSFLVLFRAVQAVGAAMLFANGPAILTRSFPASQRGQALGLQATMTYLGLTIGPSLGGWLTQQFGWRSVFFVNVPVGTAAFLLSLRFIAPDPLVRHAERFDLAGAATFLLGLVTLLLGLNQGPSRGWASPEVLGLLALSVGLLALFVFVERRVPAPMLDLTLFQRRLFSIAVGSAVLNYVCLYCVTFLMPFYLIQGRGLDPSHAGLLLSSQPVVMAVSAPLSGTLSDRIGSRWPATLGMVILAIGLYGLSLLGPTTSLGMTVAALAVSGLGTGVFISPNTSALMGSAPRERQGIASGVLATARNVGMVLGVGLAGAIFGTIMRQSAGDSADTALFAATRLSFIVASGIALAAAALAASRGDS